MNTLIQIIAIPVVTAAALMALFAGRRAYTLTLSVLVIAAILHIFAVDGSPVWTLLFGRAEKVAPQSTLASAYAVVTIAGYAALAFAINTALNWAGKSAGQMTGPAIDPNTGLSRHNPIKPRYTFADVDGMASLKKKLTSQAREIVAGNNNGILFFGAPGNGKTFIAEAFAGEINTLVGQKKPIGFLSVSMGDLASRWINQGTEQVKDLFAQAAQAALHHGGLVLFLDEIDSILPERSDIPDQNSEKVQIVNTMLTLLVDYRNFTQHHIIIVGATNFLDRLDKAAVREGRFDFKEEIAAPDRDARIGLLTGSARAAKLSKETAGRVAGRWEGFGVARLRHVGELAAKKAKEAGRADVTFDDLMLALRETQGCKGANLPEGTPSLNQLSFEDGIAERLKSLARRMTEIDRIESLGGTVPKGVLLYGPPGTGKTAVTKALAVSSGWAFLSTTGQQLMSDANELNRIVTKASDLRPAIVFIDEADDILANRATNPYGKSATNNLLAMIDGDRPLRDVMFVAATNFADAMDEAAVRGGRFGEHFYLAPPSEDTLVTILAAFISGKESAPWADDFTPAAAVKMLRHFDADISPATAKDRVQQAINRAVSRLDGSQVTLADLAAVL